MRRARPGYFHPLDFARYGRSRGRQDEMTLIRLITVIETRRIQRRVATTWRWAEKNGKEKKRETRENIRSSVQLISRFPAKNSIFVSDEVSKGWDANIVPARCDSLPCHVCALIRGQKVPSPWCIRAYKCTCIRVVQSTWLDVIARGYIVSDEVEGCPSVA